jgi:hypothetical protein
MKRFFITVPLLLFFLAAPILSSVHAFTYYLPYYENDTFDETASGYALRNLSETASASVQITVFDEFGTATSPVSKNIPANGQWRGVVGDGSDLVGWTQIESDQQLAGLCFIFKDECMMDVPITDQLYTKLVVPHSAQNRKWDTIAYVANPNEGSADLTLSFYDQNGVLVASKNHTLGPNASDQYEFTEILDGKEADQGSLEITSSQGVTAFVLYNDRKFDLYDFAGINAYGFPTSNFDGTWSGTATSTTPTDIEGDPCGSATFQFTVSGNTFTGTGTDSGGETFALEGSVAGDGSIVGILSDSGEPGAVISGKATATSASGEFRDIAGCRGTWTVTKQ